MRRERRRAGVPAGSGSPRSARRGGWDGAEPNREVTSSASSPMLEHGWSSHWMVEQWMVERLMRMNVRW